MSNDGRGSRLPALDSAVPLYPAVLMFVHSIHSSWIHLLTHSLGPVIQSFSYYETRSSYLLSLLPGTVPHL